MIGQQTFKPIKTARMLLKDGSDVIIDRLLTKKQIIIALAAACSISEAEILIIGDITESTEIESGVSCILCRSKIFPYSYRYLFKCLNQSRL
jgi:hypothetical protein